MKRREPITVNGRRIGDGEPIFLTAEIGAAHVGNFEDAKKMMKGAADAGCDGADMFMAQGSEFYHDGFGMKEGRDGPDSREVWRRQSFSYEQWQELFEYAEQIGIILYPTPLDLPSLEWARDLKAPMINLNSDDLNNVTIHEEAARLGIPITMHDINGSLAEVEGAVRTLLDNGCRDIIVLHSTQESGEEATLYASANLNVMKTYRQAFSGLGVMAGCVEHTTSDFLIYAVAALEPALISKHILLEHEEGLPDNAISVDVNNLGTMIRKVRYVEMSLGSGANQSVVGPDGQLSYANRARRKVLVAARDLPAGHVIEKGDLVAKRPGAEGLHPWAIRQLVGSTTAQLIQRDTVVNLNMFKDFPDTGYKFPAPDTVTVKSTKNIRGA